VRVECESSHSARIITVRLPVVALPVLVLSCIRGRSDMTRTYMSPSGNYQMRATINQNNTDKTEHLCLKLHLSDAGGKELLVYQPV
jgi:hypothetical protein